MANDQVSKRYAKAWIDAAKEKSAIATLAADCKTLQSALDTSADFRAFVQSPLISQSEQEAVVEAFAKKAKLDSISANFLMLLAQNRRLSALPAILSATERMLADEAGELQAVVTAATALDAGNIKDISAQLTKKLGKTVQVETRVDPAIIGGLVIRVGSTLIDDSVKTKLDRLQRNLQSGTAA